jgi:hypothetical protein
MEMDGLEIEGKTTGEGESDDNRNNFPRLETKYVSMGTAGMFKLSLVMGWFKYCVIGEVEEEVWWGKGERPEEERTMGEGQEEEEEDEEEEEEEDEGHEEEDDWMEHAFPNSGCAGGDDDGNNDLPCTRPAGLKELNKK